MKTLNFKGQNYKALKGKCNTKNLFVDPIFKANFGSLCYSSCSPFQNNMNRSDIVWMRPHVL